MQPNLQDVSDHRTTRRDPAEDCYGLRSADWLSRSHVAIVALGCPTAPDDRLIGLQSAVARFIGLLARCRMPRFRLPRLGGTAGLLRHL